MLAAEAFLAGCAMAGAKARPPLCCCCGPAKAVPLLQSWLLNTINIFSETQSIQLLRIDKCIYSGCAADVDSQSGFTHTQLPIYNFKFFGQPPSLRAGTKELSPGSPF